MISEHKMRVEVYHMAKTSLLDLFIHERLEVSFLQHCTSLLSLTMGNGLRRGGGRLIRGTLSFT